MQEVILVTGGAGFIGSAVVRHLIRHTPHKVLNVDKLTYAARLSSVDMVSNDPRYSFVQADICDAAAIQDLFRTHQPTKVMHLAAESHVDRSIDGPAAFIDTNINGTYVMLQAALDYWRGLESGAKDAFRFLHISTDEVFGTLGEEGLFHEEYPYRPNSPYSASKAASDHLVRAWHETYGLPTLMTNCTNNYGPHQFPEKLIPLVILKILAGEEIPVYGKGDNIRDWLYVEDHVTALLAVLLRGTPGETYCVGGANEKTNLEVVHTLCALVDELAPEASRADSRDLIRFVTDRPGHDQRYAMNIRHIGETLDWRPAESFESGLRKTVQWFLDNRGWWQDILGDNYQGQRLGLKNSDGKTGQ